MSATSAFYMHDEANYNWFHAQQFCVKLGETF